MAEPFWDFPFATGVDAQPYFPGPNTSPIDIFRIAGFILPGPVKVESHRRSRTHKKNAPGTDGITATHLGYEQAEVTVRMRIWTDAQWQVWQKILPVIQPNPGKDVVNFSDVQSGSSSADLGTPGPQTVQGANALSNTSAPGGLFGGVTAGSSTSGNGNILAASFQGPDGDVKQAGPQPVQVYHPFLKAQGITKLYVEDVWLPTHTNIPQVMEIKIVLVEFSPTQSGAVSTKTKVTPTGGLNVPIVPALAPQNVAPSNYAPAPTPQAPNVTAVSPSTSVR
jgi:hypothetical protein